MANQCVWCFIVNLGNSPLTGKKLTCILILPLRVCSHMWLRHRWWIMEPSFPGWWRCSCCHLCLVPMAHSMGATDYGEKQTESDSGREGIVLATVLWVEYRRWWCQQCRQGMTVAWIVWQYWDWWIVGGLYVYLEGKVKWISKVRTTACGSAGGSGRKNRVMPVPHKDQPGLLGWVVRGGRSSHRQADNDSDLHWGCKLGKQFKIGKCVCP